MQPRNLPLEGLVAWTGFVQTAVNKTFQGRVRYSEIELIALMAPLLTQVPKSGVKYHRAFARLFEIIALHSLGICKYF